MKSVDFDYRLETANDYMSKYVCISYSFNLLLFLLLLFYYFFVIILFVFSNP